MVLYFPSHVQFLLLHPENAKKIFDSCGIMWVEVELQNIMEKMPIISSVKQNKGQHHPKTKLETLKKGLPEIPENQYSSSSSLIRDYPSVLGMLKRFSVFPCAPKTESFQKLSVESSLSSFSLLWLCLLESDSSPQLLLQKFSFIC